MPEILLAARSALVTVLLVAVLGKLLSRPTGWELPLMIVEIFTVAMLVIAGRSLLVSALVVVLCAGYFAYALTRRLGERCHCFGEKLPTTGVVAQRWRNLFLATLALLYLFTVAAGAGQGHMILVDSISGVMIGLALILVPWVIDWSLTPGSLSP